MSFTPTPVQTLILWALIAGGGSGRQQDLRPRLTRPLREPLAKAGLIALQRTRHGIEIDVTDRGWAWVAGHLDAPLPASSAAAGPILQAVLGRLGSFLDARNLALAEVFTEPPQSTAPTEKPRSNDLRQRIRDAYQRLSGGKSGERVRLHELRRQLDDVDRATLDQTLLSMQREEDLVLMKLANAADIAEEDRRAAVVVGGHPRHVVYLGA